MFHGPLVKLVVESPRKASCFVVAMQERNAWCGDTHDREVVTILSAIRQVAVNIPIWCWVTVNSESFAVEGIAPVHQSITVKLRDRMSMHINGEGWMKLQDHCPLRVKLGQGRLRGGK